MYTVIGQGAGGHGPSAVPTYKPTKIMLAVTHKITSNLCGICGLAHENHVLPAYRPRLTHTDVATLEQGNATSSRSDAVSSGPRVLSLPHSLLSSLLVIIISSSLSLPIEKSFAGAALGSLPAASTEDTSLRELVLQFSLQ